MKERLQWIRSTIRSAWRRLLSVGRKQRTNATRLRSRGRRSRHEGRIGDHTCYVIHASEPPDPAQTLEPAIEQLLQASRQRFLNGEHFEPFAQQVERSSAVITGRMRQGEETQAVDHLIAIFPTTRT